MPVIVTRRLDGIVHGQFSIRMCKDCYNKNPVLSTLSLQYAISTNTNDWCELCNEDTDGLLTYTKKMKKIYDTDVPTRYKWITS